jgi:transposase
MLEKSRLRGLFLQGSLSIDQIAKEMQRSKSAVERQLRRMELRRKTETHQVYQEEFREAVVTYYYSTNGPETCAKFNISQGTLEGFITRRNKKLSLKNQYKKNEWTTSETLILLRYIGLKPLSYIAIKLDKTESSVKSYLKRRGYRLRYVNGLSQDLLDNMFTRTSSLPFMRNNEGDIFIPWTTLEDYIDTITNGDEFQKIIIRSMANFQRFLHQAENNKTIKEKIWITIEE